MEAKFYVGIALGVLFLTSACSGKQIIMTAERLSNGQYVICESGATVLQYNYQTVYEQDVIRPESQKDIRIEYYPINGGIYLDEYYKFNPGVEKTGKAMSAIYAIPRSDYIHPLYGLDNKFYKF